MKIKEKGYEILINKINDFEKLIFFNKQIFGKESDYNNEDFVLSMKKIIKAHHKNFFFVFIFFMFIKLLQFCVKLKKYFD